MPEQRFKRTRIGILVHSAGGKMDWGRIKTLSKAESVCVFDAGCEEGIGQSRVTITSPMLTLSKKVTCSR